MKSKALISSAVTGWGSRGNLQAQAGSQPFYSQRKITRTLCRADSEQPAALPGAPLSSETEQTRLYKHSGRGKPGATARQSRPPPARWPSHPACRRWTDGMKHSWQKHRLEQPAVPRIAATLGAGRTAPGLRVGTLACSSYAVEMVPPPETLWLIQSPGRQECTSMTRSSSPLLWDRRVARAHRTPSTENRGGKNQLNTVL